MITPYLSDATDIRAACMGDDPSDSHVRISLGTLREIMIAKSSTEARLVALRNAIDAHQRDASEIKDLARQFCELTQKGK